MKKVLLLVTLLIVSVTLFAQDVVVLKHTNYTSHYSKSKKYPVMVEWWETRAKIGCSNPLPRKDNFKPDPLLPKETDLGAEAAQTHRLNAGDWKSLETMTREWAVKDDSVHIWAGNVGEIKRIGKVAVPKQCWKVVYYKKSNEWMAFLFDNDQSAPDGVYNNKVELIDIEKLTGLKFK